MIKTSGRVTHSFRSKLKGPTAQRGSAILEVLVYAGILLSFSLVVSQMLQSAKGLSKYFDIRDARIERNGILQRSILVGSNCGCMFRNVMLPAPIPPGFQVNVPDPIALRIDPANCDSRALRTFAEVGKNNDGLVTESIALTNFGARSGNMIPAELLILSKNKSNSLGGVSLKDTIPVNLEVSVAGTAIIGCGEESLAIQNIEPIWGEPVRLRKSPRGGGFIRYTFSNVPEGDQVLLAKLDVRWAQNYSIEFGDENGNPIDNPRVPPGSHYNFYAASTGVDGHIRHDSQLVVIKVSNGQFSANFGCGGDCGMSKSNPEEQTRVTPVALFTTVGAE